jgi:glycosyltransferase involved in cell wall biosynthesis
MGTMHEPLVSVVIPVFDAERTVGQALASVLVQTHRTLEVLVVDDGSADRSAEVVRRFSDARVQLVAEPHRGPGAARNAGVARAGGALLAFLDADDLWDEHKLERQWGVLRASPSVDMVFGHAIPVRAAADGTLVPCGAPVPGHSAGTLLIPAATFHHVGPFATHWRVGEFVDWYARAMDRGLSQTMLPDVVLKRRLHDGNLGARARCSRQDYARIVAAAVGRRRAAARDRRATDAVSVPAPP